MKKQGWTSPCLLLGESPCIIFSSLHPTRTTRVPTHKVDPAETDWKDLLPTHPRLTYWSTVGRRWMLTRRRANGGVECNSGVSYPWNVRSVVSDVSWSSKQAGSTTVGGLPSAVHDDGGKVVKPKADYNKTRAGGGGAGEEKIKKMYARAACGMCFSCTL